MDDKADRLDDCNYNLALRQIEAQPLAVGAWDIVVLGLPLGPDARTFGGSCEAEAIVRARLHERRVAERGAR
jgi:hypothetical protein